MPTKKPRVFLTLGERDEDALAFLSKAWSAPRQTMIRKAIRQAAIREGWKPKA